ncbi:MAG: MBL fold metallo-hydrolase [Gammaproteobacteria bacterium]
MPELPAVCDFDHGISAIDTDYVRPRLDASHLIVRGGRAAFVDVGVNHSVPKLLDALKAKNLDPGDVDWVFLTHVHLDHAGGAGELLKHLPNARVLVHPRGAPHLVHPEKLVAATKVAYGAARFAALYGEIAPIPAERIETAADNSHYRMDGSEFTFIHTPGHALHHYCIVDPVSRSVFAGDSFGVSYRAFDTSHGAFVMPATTPTHFDPAQAHASVDRILSFEPAAIFVTHYSRLTEVSRLAADMHNRLDRYVAIAQSSRAQGAERVSKIKELLHAYLVECLRAHGCTLDQSNLDAWLEMDVDLNAQGLAFWLNRIQQ